jgi:excisionase family DNA binding protein
MKIIRIGGVPLQLLSFDEAAKALGVSDDTVRREIGRKKLGQFKLGYRVYVTTPQLEAYVAGCEHPAATEGKTKKAGGKQSLPGIDALPRLEGGRLVKAKPDMS